MSLTKKLASVALASIVCVGSVAHAAENTSLLDSHHRALISTIEETGVRVYVNPSVCAKEEGVNGFYISNGGVFVVCQDNASSDGKEVKWTSNDLDTIRHESVHLLQDCIDGRGNNTLHAIIPKTLDRMVAAFQILGSDAIKIINRYRSRGASDVEINMELEAFSFARAVPASEIEKKVRQVCLTK